MNVGYNALRTSSFNRTSLANADVGIMLGMMNSDHVQQISRLPGPYDMTGNGISFAASRLSFVFAVRGPCIATDTACSSSLVATHIAIRLIQNKECPDAVSIGSNCILSPRGAFSMFAIAGMLSSHGRCHTFDSRANGYQRGEGGAAVVSSSSGEHRLVYSGSSCLHNG